MSAIKRWSTSLSCLLGLLLIFSAAHSAWIERDYSRACFELLISIMVYPQGWFRDLIPKAVT